jgi:hypothetical protein
MKESSKTKMLAIIIVAAVFFLLPISAVAQEIEYNKIEKLALKVFSLKSNRSTSSLKISKALPIYADKDIAYYIFNFEPAGHIIISTNKAFEPILGYGLNSTIDFDSIPLGLKFLLDNYKEEINKTKKQGLITSKETSTKWDNYTNLDVNISSQSYSAGTYLLQTTWAQGNGYNRFCPLEPNTNLRTIVGCGGVALGQILYYWQCRVFPDNSITYTPDGFLSPLTVNFYGQNYNWAAMSKTSSDDYNALLLFHSAAAIRANFGSASTTNFADNTRTALVTYFGFNANNIQYKDSYTNSTWINMLKTEINAERPIYYSGYNYNGNYGHAWVIDGYNSSDFFHCNWGWSGSSNGWYALSALNPSSYSLNDGQSAILNVYPMLDACYDLNGSSTICSSNSSYSISIPTSASVVWSKSSNLTQVGSNTSTSYTVCPITNGMGYTTATIYNSQNQVFMTRTKTISVGAPGALAISSYSNLDISDYANGAVNILPSGGYYAYEGVLSLSDDSGVATSYQWSVATTYPTGKAVFWWPNGSSVDVATKFSNTNITLKCTASNSCGSYTKYVYFYNGAIIVSIISPNPAADEVSVSIADAPTVNTILATSSNVNTTSTYTVSVVDSYGTTVYSGTKKDKKFNIKTSTFKNGIYVVVVSDGTNIYQNKLIIQH